MGRIRRCGLAREKPALRSALHCIGVRTPLRSPRKMLSAARGFSPWYTLIRTEVCMSLAVV